ncbi:antitoxin MazE [Enterococcus olivae]
MELKAEKIGHSVGILFPKDSSPKVGDSFIVSKIGEAYLLKPKKENIFQNDEDWHGFKESLIEKDMEWDTMRVEGAEQ